MPRLEDDRSKSKDGEEAAVMDWLLEPGVVSKLYDVFTVAGLRVDAIEPGLALCSFTVPPRLTVRKDLTPYILAEETASYCMACRGEVCFKVIKQLESSLPKQIDYSRTDG